MANDLNLATSSRRPDLIAVDRALATMAHKAEVVRAYFDLRGTIDRLPQAIEQAERLLPLVRPLVQAVEKAMEPVSDEALAANLMALVGAFPTSPRPTLRCSGAGCSRTFQNRSQAASPSCAPAAGCGVSPNGSPPSVKCLKPWNAKNATPP